MIKLIFSTSSTGTEDANHTNFLAVINPQSVDLQESKDIIGIETIHGAKVWQESIYDNRERVLSWNGVSASSGFSASVKDMVDYIDPLLGEIIYINFGSLESINYQWPTANEWKKCRCIDL